jgi:hypothetical protein
MIFLGRKDDEEQEEEIMSGAHQNSLLRSKKLASALIDIVASGRSGVSGTKTLRAFPLAALGSDVDDASVRMVPKKDATGPLAVSWSVDRRANIASDKRLREGSSD